MGQIQYSEKYFDDTYEYRYIDHFNDTYEYSLFWVIILLSIVSV